MECIALASGSSGNCLYIESGESAVLVDAGLSKREILARLSTVGGRADWVQAILVTHEHVDHMRGVFALARSLKIPVVATGGTLHEFIRCRGSSIMPVELVRCRFDERLEVGDFAIETHPTSHDAKEPCAFRVRENGTSIGCCTDTGIISPGLGEWLSRCDALVLESNHCPEMLRTGPYPEMLKRRIRSKRGHLSNPDAAACIRSLSGQLHHVMLSHLSEVNNTPEKALATAREGVGLFMDEVGITLASNPEKDNGWPGRIRV